MAPHRGDQDGERRGEDAAPEELGFLDGCRWDKAGNKLADSAPKVLYAPLPVLYVTGVLASDKKGDAGFSFTAPCYKSPKRTDPNFIFAVDLRTEEPPAKWVLRGVCLLTMKD